MVEGSLSARNLVGSVSVPCGADSPISRPSLSPSPSVSNLLGSDSVASLRPSRSESSFPSSMPSSSLSSSSGSVLLPGCASIMKCGEARFVPGLLKDMILLYVWAATATVTPCSRPSLSPSLSVSQSVASVTKPNVPATSSPSIMPSSSLSRSRGSVSLPSLRPSRSASSTESLRPSLSVSALVGSVIVAVSASAV